MDFVFSGVCFTKYPFLIMIIIIAAYPGNYWNKQREIMAFDPKLLINYKGAIFGSGWAVSIIVIAVLSL